MIKSNRDKIIEQTMDVVKKVSIAIQNRIEKIMQQNNLKLCYFVVDTIKALVPTVKFTTSKMKITQEAFSNHLLGILDMQLKKLKNYFRRSETTSSESGQSDENVYKPTSNNTFNY